MGKRRRVFDSIMFQTCYDGTISCECGGDLCVCGADGQDCLGCEKCEGRDDQDFDEPEQPHHQNCSEKS